MCFIWLWLDWCCSTHHGLHSHKHNSTNHTRTTPGMLWTQPNTQCSFPHALIPQSCCIPFPNPFHIQALCAHYSHSVHHQTWTHSHLSRVSRAFSACCAELFTFDSFTPPSALLPQALRARYARALHQQSGAAAAMAAEHAAAARLELAGAAGGGARRVAGGPAPQMMPMGGMPRGDNRWAPMSRDMLGSQVFRMPGWAAGRGAGGRGGRPGAPAHGLDGVGSEEVGVVVLMVCNRHSFDPAGSC